MADDHEHPDAEEPIPDEPDGYDDAEDLEPWERRMDETPKAWAAFAVYRDLGPTRSLAQAAELALVDSAASLPSKRRHLQRWSGRFAWVERCAAYDAHVDKLARVAHAAAIADMRKRHAEAAVTMLNKGMERLRQIRVRGMPVDSARLLVTEAAKLERVARGEAEVVADVNLTPGRRVGDPGASDYDLARRLMEDPEAMAEAEMLVERLMEREAG